MGAATAMPARLAQERGHQYQATSADWHTLCSMFFKRMFGHNQVTDAYLLGVAVREGLVLVTFDRTTLHLAGEHAKQVLSWTGMTQEEYKEEKKRYRMVSKF